MRTFFAVLIFASAQAHAQTSACVSTFALTWEGSAPARVPENDQDIPLRLKIPANACPTVFPLTVSVESVPVTAPLKNATWEEDFIIAPAQQDAKRPGQTLDFVLRVKNDKSFDPGESLRLRARVTGKQNVQPAAEQNIALVDANPEVAFTVRESAYHGEGSVKLGLTLRKDEHYSFRPFTLKYSLQAITATGYGPAQEQSVRVTPGPQTSVTIKVPPASSGYLLDLRASADRSYAVGTNKTHLLKGPPPSQESAPLAQEGAAPEAEKVAQKLPEKTSREGKDAKAGSDKSSSEKADGEKTAAKDKDGKDAESKEKKTAAAQKTAARKAAAQEQLNEAVAYVPDERPSYNEPAYNPQPTAQPTAPVNPQTPTYGTFTPPTNVYGGTLPAARGPSSTPSTGSGGTPPVPSTPVTTPSSPVTLATIPTVSLEVSGSPTVAESATDSRVRLIISLDYAGGAAAGTTLKFKTSGEARRGLDYRLVDDALKAISGDVFEIKPGHTKALIWVEPINNDDASDGNSKAVRVELEVAPGYNVLASKRDATAYVIDDDRFSEIAFPAAQCSITLGEPSLETSFALDITHPGERRAFTAKLEPSGVLRAGQDFDIKNAEGESLPRDSSGNFEVSVAEDAASVTLKFVYLKTTLESGGTSAELRLKFGDMSSGSVRADPQRSERSCFVESGTTARALAQPGGGRAPASVKSRALNK